MSSKSRALKVAVVGVAAQIPSGTFASTDLDYSSFFQFLLQGGEAYEPIPKERFNTQFIRGNSVGKVVTDTGAFLKDIDTFDPLEFGITARDARLMPVSTRKLLETSFLSLQDSGIDYRGKNVGCFMSGVAHDQFSVSGHDDTEAKGSFAIGPSMVANRVSYHLDLRGPSVPIDTACSSSLYATHLAVQALRNGECEAAVVGGCQINHRFTEWLTYTQGGVLSPDGKCKPFDASANGFGRGEGVICIVLKPLEDAVHDHDHIYATILGTGVNSSGSLAPVNAPVASAQADAMRRAFSYTDRLPQEVDFLELHATGTAQGDPSEANWVGRNFHREDELLVGSVKGNIGHLEIAAFLASLCKVCGIFETGLIPPNVNLINPNPAIHWAEHRLRVPREVERLRCRSSNSGRPPLIAMTSSGIGGANGHCVVEGRPLQVARPTVFWTEDAKIPALLVAGGLSPRSTSALASALIDATTASDDGKAALARIFGRRARSMTWRSTAVVQVGKQATFAEPILVPKKRPPIVFVFSGQGTQYYHMGRDLFKSCSVFRSSILELDEVYKASTGTSLVELGLFTDVPYESSDPLGDPWPIVTMLPALTMLQLALFDTLIAAGVSPDIVVGHSAGETAVLAACGAASKAAALELAIARGQALSVVETAEGTMAAFSCSPAEASSIIAAVKAELGDGVLEIGCYNTPGAVTLSGAESHILLAVAKANEAGIFARKLRTRVPVHSAMMELCRNAFEREVGNVFARHPVSPPTVETYSTLTGQHFESLFNAQYFWDGTLRPVQFTSAIQSLSARHPNATFVEIGPHPVLTSYIVSMSGKSAVVTCPMRRHKVPQEGLEVAEFLSTLGKLVTAGHNCVNFDALYGTSRAYTGTLPRYPFAAKKVPWYFPTAEIVRQRQHRNGPLNYPQLQINSQTHPALAEHIIKGEPIMPAAGFIEMALEFGASELYNVEFHALLPLSSERPVPVDVRLEGTRWSVNGVSSANQGRAWPIQYDRTHATGFLSMRSRDDIAVAKLDFTAIRQRMKPVDMNGFYTAMSYFAQYGPTYRRIRQCHIATSAGGRIEALTELRGDDSDLVNFSDYRLHPAILDAAIHIVAHPNLTGNHDPDLYHLPSKVGVFRLCPGFGKRPFPKLVYTHAVSVDWSPKATVYDVTIANEEGVPLCIFERLEVSLHGHRLKKIDKRFDLTYEKTNLRLLPPPATPPSSGGEWEFVTPFAGTLACSDDEHSLILEYVHGEEMKLQAAILPLDVNEPWSILIVAEEGINGSASLGFSRSLRKEYPFWTVRVAVFASPWTLPQRAQALRILLTMDTTDLEIIVDTDGLILLPRINASQPPPAHIPFDSTKPWVFENNRLIQTHVPKAVDDYVVVHVTGVSPSHHNACAFIGVVEGASRPVVGVSSAPRSSHIQVHRDSVVELDSAFFSDACAPPILASTLLALVVGPHTITRPQRLNGKRLLVAVEPDDRVLGSQIEAIGSGLGMDVKVLYSPLAEDQLQPFYLHAPHYVLSGIIEARDVTILRSLVSSGRILLWNHPHEGIAHFAAIDPWALGDAVRSASAFHPGSAQLTSVPFVPPAGLLDSSLTTTACVSFNLFDPHKSYLLVGGIGSIGLHVALWMYEHGAGHLILTSRTGPSSLDKRGDLASQRILAYLLNQSDLSLRTAAVDAASDSEMVALARGISPPLAGCMFLSALLNDRTFAAHTQETFDSVFPPKTDAFQALEKAVGYESLDFVIAVVSISGMFGNPGQTSYAAANTALAGLTRKYPNAFSIVSPIILDSRIVTLTDETYNSRVRHMVKWGMTARELCDYIGDGIRKVRADPGSVWQYIPDFDWRAVRDNMGPSKLYDHLVPKESSEDEEGNEGDGSGAPSLVQTVCRVLDLKVEDVSLDVPLTAYGLDSLSAASLSYALRSLLAISQIQLLADVTIKDLQTKLEGVDEPPEAPAAQLTKARPESTEYVDGRVGEMKALLDELTADLPSRPTSVHGSVRRHGAVVVTGTTGSVGAHILEHLLQDSPYAKVYALVRPGKDAAMTMARQFDAFAARGLDVRLLTSERLAVVGCTFERERLGLSAAEYEEIRTSVSHIIHVGWPVNFEAPLSSFKNALVGLRRLIDLANAAQEFGPVSLLYGSSSGIFKNYNETAPPRERPLDPVVAVGEGYSESKWIAEHMVQVASERNLVRGVVVRIGQQTGGKNGAWKPTEWFPAIVAAGAALGCLPTGQGVVTWLPVEVAAQALVEMVDVTSPYTILHLRHPRPIGWSDIMSELSRLLRVSTVPYEEWLSRITTAHPDRRLGKFVSPALTLVDHLRPRYPDDEALRVRVTENNGLSVLMDVEDSLPYSAVLSNPSLPQLNREEVRKWIDYWRSVGALPTM
ncbi:ketoacyl-synt-domain-containing protein [Dichomitus squalens LYAD-421 SS1]|uniref:Ketoacyl-synt-domain-containing protein n=1 Tax=Dichomitus squalens (strain LYAD-421) TaxID=732165 RepID=R7SW67_DICSQ|nr:ketoacyl-synt-domain-containing protein [Dichomitus squalens LYAD-421 SS1]EJF59192.1 ketoacyl-synt-domain-containing protein [Dichomitus squalens LYAD-421 SS1]